MYKHLFIFQQEKRRINTRTHPQILFPICTKRGWTWFQLFSKARPVRFGLVVMVVFCAISIITDLPTTCNRAHRHLVTLAARTHWQKLVSQKHRAKANEKFSNHYFSLEQFLFYYWYINSIINNLNEKPFTINFARMTIDFHCCSLSSNLINMKILIWITYQRGNLLNFSVRFSLSLRKYTAACVCVLSKFWNSFVERFFFSSKTEQSVFFLSKYALASR